DKLHGHSRAGVPDPRGARSEVPPRLSAIVARMTAIDPQQRYATPAEAAAALAEFSHAAPPANASPARPAKKLSRRNLAIIASGVLLAAIVGIAFAVGGGASNDGENSPAAPVAAGQPNRLLL